MSGHWPKWPSHTPAQTLQPLQPPTGASALSSKLQFDLARAAANPPENPKGREVEFLPTEGIYGNEEITVYRQPDHRCAQARGIGDFVARLVQGVGHRHGDVPQVARQVRRHRHLDDVQDEGTRVGEPVATVSQHNARPKPIVDKPSIGDYH